MKSSPVRSVPFLIATVIIALACLIEVVHPYSQDRIECITYDWRVKFAQRYSPSSTVTATNLGFVQITDDTIENISDGTYGFKFGLYWPRQLYGRVLKELSAQGARAVAFDVLFANQREDQPPVTLASGNEISSDEYFARAIKQSGRAILAATPQLLPEPLFRANAWQLGNIAVEKDSSGILRRDRPIVTVRFWHPLLKKLARRHNLDLARTVVDSNSMAFYCERDHSTLRVPVDAGGAIKIADLKFEGLPEDAPTEIIPFETRRTWSLGVVLAARELNLDLEHPIIEKDRITLNGPNGVQRVIPLDFSGTFHIDWGMGANHPNLKVGVFEDLIVDSINRGRGQDASTEWTNRLVVIGSVATGNDLTDLGATPLDKEAFLVSKHWNVANAIITNRFIQLCPEWATILLILFAGGASAWVTWNTRPLTGLAIVLLTIIGYAALSFWAFAEFRFWLPMVIPCALAELATHVVTVTYRVRLESQERSRVKNIFSKLVAPSVVNELLSAPDPNKIKGARTELTVLFADVRGFTALTDSTQLRAEEFVRTNNLGPAEAEAHFDQAARSILENVSECLATISESIMRHNGTLDKYIGDCVMAFWGAPKKDPQHALQCVRAAIDAQRGLYALNQKRVDKNKEIEAENAELAKQGLPPKPLLPLISLGTGINSGQAIVGLMGSEAYGQNYTVFGREINLASRLEGVSGHGRIVIGEATYLALKRDEPALAQACVELEHVKVKGFSQEVRAYEVPWRTEAHPKLEAAPAPAPAAK